MSLWQTGWMESWRTHSWSDNGDIDVREVLNMNSYHVVPPPGTIKLLQRELWLVLWMLNKKSKESNMIWASDLSSIDYWSYKVWNNINLHKRQLFPFMKNENLNFWSFDLLFFSVTFITLSKHHKWCHVVDHQLSDIVCGCMFVWFCMFKVL